MEKYIFVALVVPKSRLDPEALGHILHRRFKLSVPSPKLFLEQCRILGIRSFHSYGVKEHFFMFKHK